jgi:hypothetical protein
MVHRTGSHGDDPSADWGDSPPTATLTPIVRSAGRESVAGDPVWNPNRETPLFHGLRR